MRFRTAMGLILGAVFVAGSGMTCGYAEANELDPDVPFFTLTGFALVLFIGGLSFIMTAISLLRPMSKIQYALWVLGLGVVTVLLAPYWFGPQSTGVPMELDGVLWSAFIASAVLTVFVASSCYPTRN